MLTYRQHFVNASALLCVLEQVVWLCLPSEVHQTAFYQNMKDCDEQREQVSLGVQRNENQLYAFSASLIFIQENKRYKLNTTGRCVFKWSWHVGSCTDVQSLSTRIRSIPFSL